MFLSRWLLLSWPLTSPKCHQHALRNTLAGRHELREGGGVFTFISEFIAARRQLLSSLTSPPNTHKTGRLLRRHRSNYSLRGRLTNYKLSCCDHDFTFCLFHNQLIHLWVSGGFWRPCDNNLDGEGWNVGALTRSCTATAQVFVSQFHPLARDGNSVSVMADSLYDLLVSGHSYQHSPRQSGGHVLRGSHGLVRFSWIVSANKLSESKRVLLAH